MLIWSFSSRHGAFSRRGLTRCPLGKEGSCEYTQQEVMDSRQGWSSGSGDERGTSSSSPYTAVCYEMLHRVSGLGGIFAMT